MKYFVVVALIFFASDVQAQNAISPTLFTKITDSLILQRNTALNSQAMCEANLGVAKDEIASFKAELEKLKQPATGGNGETP